MHKQEQYRRIALSTRLVRLYSCSTRVWSTAVTY